MIGYVSGSNTTTGYNTMVGYYAGYSNVTGSSAAYFGYRAGYANLGTSNTFLGTESGYYNANGSNNVFVGVAAGRHSDGSDNVFIGRYAGYGELGDDQLVIENNYTGSDNNTNALIYGDFGLNRLRFNGNTSINGSSANQYYALELNLDANDTYGLVVYGQAYCSSGAWTSSDLRLKKNIDPVSNALGSILKLNGVKFDWRTEEFPEMGFTKAKQIGLIAQDVEKVIPELVNEGPNGYKSVDYSKIAPVLIEAIKEQQKMIDELRAEIELLKKK